MIKCLYCTTKQPEDRESCGQCGAPLPMVTTAYGIPKFVEARSFAELYFQEPPPPFPRELSTRFIRQRLTNRLDWQAGSNTLYYEVPRAGYLEHFAIRSLTPCFCSVRVIVNASINLLWTPELPLPISYAPGYINTEVTGRTTIQLERAREMPTTTIEIIESKIVGLGGGGEW